MFRVINGNKIKNQRGNRSLKSIALASGNCFTDVALSEWENGKYKPKDANIPALLTALGCQYEDISDAVDLSQTQAI